MPALESGIEELRPEDLTPAASLAERAEAATAFLCLVLVDLVMRSAGFRRVHGLVRRFPRRHPRRPPGSTTVERWCTAVDRAAAFYLRRAWCLQRAATTTCLLRLAGVEAQMVIGACKLPFYAHAWVEVGGEVVNDHPAVRQRYHELDRC